MDKHAIIRLKKEGHSNRKVIGMLHINQKTAAKYWNDYVKQINGLSNQTANVKVIQEEICSEPTYDTSRRKCRKYTKEMDMYLDEILADEVGKSKIQEKIDQLLPYKPKLELANIKRVIAKVYYEANCKMK